jgi:hypothetical protein
MLCKLHIKLDYPPEWDDPTDPENSMWLLAGWGNADVHMIVPGEDVLKTVQIFQDLGHSVSGIEYMEEENGKGNKSESGITEVSQDKGSGSSSGPDSA